MRPDGDRSSSTPRAANEEGSGRDRPTDLVEGSDPLTVEQLRVRRRQRRTRNAALAVVLVVAVFALVIGLSSFDSDDEGTSGVAGDSGEAPSPPATAPRVTVGRTGVFGGDGGTARVVMDFDGPLPGGDVLYVEDITSLDAADGIVYTTQEPGSVHVCESIHNFPPPAVGTVDLLIPADWFADGDDTHTSQIEESGNPAKFVVCGPHDGYYQYAIWGPVSADADDVNVTIDPDRTRLIVQIDSEPDPTTTDPTAQFRGVFAPDGCEPIEVGLSEPLSGVDPELIDGLSPSGHPYEGDGIEPIRRHWLRGDGSEFAEVQYPGTAPVGDPGDLVTPIERDDIDAAVVPSVFHTPDPWRLLVTLPGRPSACQTVTVLSFGATAEELEAIGYLLVVTPISETEASPTGDDREAGDGPSDFCDAAASLEGERPEAYVGSTEHVNDITMLAALAPEAIQGPASTYRDFLKGGGVDPADPESNVVLNWPADVQAAVADLAEFVAANC